jgi:hypothetical protein
MEISLSRGERYEDGHINWVLRATGSTRIELFKEIEDTLLPIKLRYSIMYRCPLKLYEIPNFETNQYYWKGFARFTTYPQGRL